MVAKVIKETIRAKGMEIGIYKTDFENEFISLTDTAKYKSNYPMAVIQSWMRNRDVIAFLGSWESRHNLNFTHLEFEDNVIKLRHYRGITLNESEINSY